LAIVGETWRCFEPSAFMRKMASQPAPSRFTCSVSSVPVWSK
jgi:hypothetical protein